MSLSLRTPSATTITAIKAIVFFLCLVPAVNLALGWQADALGANPIETITRQTNEDSHQAKVSNSTARRQPLRDFGAATRQLKPS